MDLLVPWDPQGRLVQSLPQVQLVLLLLERLLGQWGPLALLHQLRLLFPLDQ